MSTIKVAVVILNWNGKHYLEKFLPSVIANSPKESIFVVDNNSSISALTGTKTDTGKIQRFKLK